MTEDVLPGSFRDPAGFVFEREGVLYRQVNERHRDDYDRFMSSGLYEALVSEGLLVTHEPVEEPGLTSEASLVLRPSRVPFISHPYEWCFSELKDAALATLRIQEIAMDHGMSLRDASAYNVQFVDGRPLLIDTLSFEGLEEGKPWVAYKQFCQHFLAPLALMSYRDVRLGQLLQTNIDGIPLDLAVSLLPRAARFRLGLQLHLFSHAKSQRKHQGAAVGRSGSGRAFSVQAFRGLVSSLAGAVRKLDWDPGRTTWSEYYSEAEHYSADALDSKKTLVTKLIEEVSPANVWDLGGNVGVFARVPADRGINTVCFDLDEASVEANYRKVRANGETNLLPLVLDLTTPTPSVGWANSERPSLVQRGPADLALALALVHHLAIGNNVPLPMVADFLADVCRAAIVEWVPKEDPKVQTLLASREDVFPGYTAEGFEQAVGRRFEIERSEPIAGSPRTLYLLRRR
ncbi:MAG TPA: SAM-dependent methyltransferase [Actinomycetota bacterium]|nr:SAM-dependent methyltransferase [Actinomycetota bacterium]